MKKIHIKSIVLAVSGMLMLGGCSAVHKDETLQGSRVAHESAAQMDSQRESTEEIAERDLSERQTTKEGASKQEAAEGNTSEHKTTKEEASKQEATEGNTSEQKTTKEDSPGQEITRQKLLGKYTVKGESSEQKIAKQERSGQEQSEQASSNQPEMTEDNIPVIKITQDCREWYSDDGEKLLYRAETSRVEVVNEGFDALNASFARQWNGLDDERGKEAKWAKDIYDAIEDKENDHFVNWEVSERVEINRVDRHVVSLCVHFSQFGGGAHGTYGTKGRTYDTISGRELQIEDILKDAEGFYEKAYKYITAQLDEEYKESISPNFAELVRTNTFFGEAPASWYLNDKGIVIDYQLYQIAHYASGMQSVTLPYDAFATYIKEEYLIPCGSRITRVEVNEAIAKLPCGTDGVMLTSEYSYELFGDEVTVVSGDQSEAVGIFSCIRSAYVISREDGRTFLVFYVINKEHEYVTYVYEVTGGKVRACDKMDNTAFSGTYISTDRIGLSVRLNVLGTYEGEMIYQLTEDGKLVQTEEIFAVNQSTPEGYDEFKSLKVIKELPVTINKAAASIPAGTRIWITGTDNAGKACFRLDMNSGETGLITYVRDDKTGLILIDGISEHEYFEKVPYTE